MNHLNSILIEGIAKGNPKMIGQVCYFPLEVHHTDRQKGMKTFVVNVAVDGALGQNCNSIVKKSMPLRIVGRLLEIEENAVNLGIQAEHVETRPVSQAVA